MARHPNQPIIDIQNPFYCPSLPARAYIHTLHKDVAHNRSTAQSAATAAAPGPETLYKLPAFKAFKRLLAKTVESPGNGPGDKGVLDSDLDVDLGMDSDEDSSPDTSQNSDSGSYSSSSTEHQFSISPVARVRKPILLLEHNRVTRTSSTKSRFTSSISIDSEDLIALQPRFGRLRDSRLFSRPPLKRKAPDNSDSNSLESDLRGPTKYARSLPVSEQSSFEVRLKREPLNFDLPSIDNSNSDSVMSSPESEIGSQSSDMKATGYYYPVSQATLSLWSEIRTVVPLTQLPSGPLGVNKMAQYLAENGLLTQATMRVIGRYKVSHLELNPVVDEHNGLNLGRAPELLSELHATHLFKNLISLTCNRVKIDDDAVLNFHHLPLEFLNLSKTCITNTAIFMLTSLRQTLRQLRIHDNREINDDAIPALLMFHKLEELSISGTSVDIVGLRKFTRKIRSQKKHVRLSTIPKTCEEYLNQLDRRYLVDIPPTLISDPIECHRKSITVLRENLIAHAVVNRKILTSGNKTELVTRLAGLLFIRQSDLMVKELVEGNAWKLIFRPFDREAEEGPRSESEEWSEGD